MAFKKTVDKVKINVITKLFVRSVVRASSVYLALSVSLSLSLPLPLSLTLPLLPPSLSRSLSGSACLALSRDSLTHTSHSLAHFKEKGLTFVFLFARSLTLSHSLPLSLSPPHPTPTATPTSDSLLLTLRPFLVVLSFSAVCLSLTFARFAAPLKFSSSLSDATLEVAAKPSLKRRRHGLVEGCVASHNKQKRTKKKKKTKKKV